MSLVQKRMEDTSLRPLWRLTKVLFRVRIGAHAQRDVKNEDRPGDAYENKGADDTMPDNQYDFLADNAQIVR